MIWRKWLLSVPLLALATGPAVGQSIEVGDKVPEIDAVKWYNVKGDVSMKNLRGKVVLVDFWATW